MITAVNMSAATLSMASDVKRGVQFLSGANFWVSIAVVGFILLLGSI
ncbi:hypothetical protein ACFIOZ_05520 [Vreelandella sp. F11]